MDLLRDGEELGLERVRENDRLSPEEGTWSILQTSAIEPMLNRPLPTRQPSPVPRIFLFMLLALVAAVVAVPVAFYALAVVGSKKAVDYYYG